MRKQTFLILAAVTALFVILAFALQPSDRSIRHARAGQPVAPQLKAKINDVVRVRVEKAKGALTVERKGEGWVLVEKGGYPVDPDKVKTLVVALAGMTIDEPKTNRPDRHARLGVEDLKAKESKSHLVTVTGKGGKALMKLIVGKSEAGRGGIGRGWTYYRKPGDKRAWKADGEVELQDDPAKWVEPRVAHILKTRVKQFTVTRPDGKPVTAAREKVGAEMKLTVDPLPEGMEPKSDGSVGSLANALDMLDLEDVQPAAKIDWKTKTVATSELRTFDGVVVTVRVAKLGDDKFWISLTPAYDGEGAVGPTDDAGKKAKLLAAADAKKEVEALAKAVKGWAYKVPSRQLNYFKTELKELIQKKKSS